MTRRFMRSPFLRNKTRFWICSTCSPAASRCFGVFAELKAVIANLYRSNCGPACCRRGCDLKKAKTLLAELARPPAVSGSVAPAAELRVRQSAASLYSLAGGGV